MIREGLLTTVYAKILRTEEAGLSEFEMASVLRAAQIAVSAGSAPEARALIDRGIGDHQLGVGKRNRAVVLRGLDNFLR